MKRLLILLFLFCLNSLAFDHSHQIFQNVLDKHLKTVKNQTLINYKNLKVSSNILNKYLKDLSKVTNKEFLAFTEAQQVAFLINAYNAFTIDWILKKYPVKSIKDTASFFSNPWKKEFFSLLGKKTTLHKIEHDILRAQYNIPEIHYAIVCASLSCPNLLTKVYTPQGLDTQLELAAKLFLTDKAKNHFDIKKRTLYLSKIFDWYEDDFKKKYKSVEKAVAPYITDNSVGQKMIRDKDVKVKYLNYDWSLNEWVQ